MGGEAAGGPGHFFQPAVVVDVPPDSRLATEEVFGPVLPVWRVEGLDEAIERANDTAYGLASIWTRDAVAIDRATRELEAGVTWVNQLHYGFDELPFGGTKQSGLGREHGLQALEEYTELKSVVVGGLAQEGEQMAVTAEVKDRVGWITMDRPPANSYDAAFLEELDRCVGEVAEAEVAVAVIRSASEKFFSAGADVKAFLERSPEENMVGVPPRPPSAWPVRGRVAAVHRGDRRPRPRRWLRDRPGLRHPRRGRGPLPHRAARGHPRPAARHRRHPALPCLIGRGRAWS